MTSKEYISKGGVLCPNCGSWDIAGGGVDIDAGIAWQEISCNSCNAEWTDTYRLTGYANLRLSAPASPPQSD